MIVHPQPVVPADMIPKCFISVAVISAVVSAGLAVDWRRAKDVDVRMENGIAAILSLGIAVGALVLVNFL